MTRKSSQIGVACQICGSQHADTLRSAAIVRAPVADLIRRKTGAWDESGWICLTDLQHFQHELVEEVLRAEKGELTQLEEEVLESLRKHETLSANPDLEFDAALTRGEKLADRIADFGGSWTFLTIFGLILFAWMLVNSFVLAVHPFDPYPYILLNLCLSCLAAIQAPVIMMSQKRQEARDRLRSIRDYQVNLKAELEIRHLHQKLDHLLSHQWERLVEIQEIQMELIDAIRTRGTSH
jgi:uncharacterized membrane protein